MPDRYAYIYREARTQNLRCSECEKEVSLEQAVTAACNLIGELSATLFVYDSPYLGKMVCVDNDATTGWKGKQHIIGVFESHELKAMLTLYARML